MKTPTMIGTNLNKMCWPQFNFKLFIYSCHNNNCCLTADQCPTLKLQLTSLPPPILVCNPWIEICWPQFNNLFNFVYLISYNTAVVWFPTSEWPIYSIFQSYRFSHRFDNVCHSLVFNQVITGLFFCYYSCLKILSGALILKRKNCNSRTSD